MINRLLLILAFAFLPLISFAQNRVEVKDPEIKFSYVLPEGWQVKDDGYDYIIESQDVKDAYITLTYVEKAVGTEKFESLLENQSVEEDFLFEVQYILPEDYKNFTVLKNGNTTIDENPASWVEFSHGEKADQVGVFYMFEKLNQNFKIVGSAPAGEYNNVKPIFTAILNSFRAETL